MFKNVKLLKWSIFQTEIDCTCRAQGVVERNASHNLSRAKQGCFNHRSKLKKCTCIMIKASVANEGRQGVMNPCVHLFPSVSHPYLIVWRQMTPGILSPTLAGSCCPTGSLRACKCSVDNSLVESQPKSLSSQRAAGGNTWSPLLRFLNNGII